MRFFSFLFMGICSITFAQKTINTNQDANQVIYDDLSISFEPGFQVIATNQSKFHAYIDKVYSNDPLNFDYDLSGNQIKRYVNITVSSFKSKSPEKISFDRIEIVQEVSDVVETVFQVYPNPTPGPLNIKWNTKEGIQDIQLYDLTGQEVKNYRVNKLSNTIEMDISAVSSGIYVLRFITIKGEVMSKKIIKK
ncbi:T9SS type A sorting domain-containing protein [Empedobacter brevis]|uniref:T9SS type A sorting domain-containing protein n=1 Tax=Empedobacter brevis TaxID=247 RepID=UPI00123D9AF5|nr:T9SS type A sorting domain-containing protein [Empedobacter brevis]QES91259.1 T9SS type A sorting domain-containing protein [Empedobacter brevis]